MCHLVTFFKPAGSDAMQGLNIIQTITFDSEETAKQEAADKALAGCTEVRVWCLVGSVSRQVGVQWS